MSKTFYGGQAVIEGVMMKGPKNWSLAVRAPEGNITTVNEKSKSIGERWPILKKPFLRGTVVLIETMILGIKTISLSANMSLGESEEEITSKEMIATIALALVLVVGLFMVLPIYLTRTASTLIENRLLFTIVEGFFRIGLFVGYIAIISRLNDIQRVFQYHGAEHKTIHTFEAGEELTPENASKYPTLHVRCGTSLLLIVMVIAIFTFSFLPTTNVLLRVMGKLLLLPFVAGVSYEVTRYAARHTGSAVMKFLMAPGLWLQKLTTKEPDKSQLEVAIEALKNVLRAEGVLQAGVDPEAGEIEPESDAAVVSQTSQSSCAFNTGP